MRLQAINDFSSWVVIAALWVCLLLPSAVTAAGAWSNMGKAPTPELGSFGVGQPAVSFALNESGGTDPRKKAADAPASFLRQALDPANLAIKPGFGGRSAR
jgi:hypothetical protein